jgi:hypothetical protein
VAEHRHEHLEACEGSNSWIGIVCDCCWKLERIYNGFGCEESVEEAKESWKEDKIEFRNFMKFP